MSSKMDGARVRDLISSETRALFSTYKQFEKLVKSQSRGGAAHSGEDGRFVESLLRSYLKAFLPESLEVANGFIVRPAVKTGINGLERKGEKDSHSSQLDIIVFDKYSYPVFKRFEGTVIVPPESVIAVISVKKSMKFADIVPECISLQKVAKMCKTLDSRGSYRRGPFLGLVSMGFANPPKKKSIDKGVFEQLAKAYKTNLPKFDETIGVVSIMENVSIFKKRPQKSVIEFADYFSIKHKKDEEYWGIQLLLTGIMSVYYDPTRSSVRRPGLLGFKPGRPHDGDLGRIKVSGIR